MGRALAAVALVMLAESASVACPPRDRPYVVSGGTEIGEGTFEVPPRPSIYVHLTDPGLPSFSRPDGTEVPVRVRGSLVAAGMFGKEELVLRLELEVSDGVVVVHLPPNQRRRGLPISGQYTRPDLILRISRDHVPRTRSFERSFERHGYQVMVSSDAALFRVELRDGTRAHALSFWGLFGRDVSDADVVRVVAVYPDAREEVVFGAPMTAVWFSTARLSTTPVNPNASYAWVLLALAWIVGRRRSPAVPFAG